MKPPSLRELQKSFADSVYRDEPLPAFARAVSETSEFKRRARLEVYSNAYRIRLRDTLRDDFEACAALLGARRFDALVLEYVERCPSNSWTLADFGDNFIEFLKPRARKKLVPACLPDLARFEREITFSFYAPDLGAPPELPDLATWPPAQLAKARLELDPSVKLIESRWPVVRLWQERAELTPRHAPRAPVPTFGLIHRTPRWVTTQKISRLEYVLLTAIARNIPLGRWPAWLQKHRLDFTKFDVLGTFAKWRGNGILRSIR